MSEVRAEIADNSRRVSGLEHAIGANASAEFRNGEDCDVLAGQRERLREARAEALRLNQRAEAIEAEISRFERQKMCDPSACCRWAVGSQRIRRSDRWISPDCPT